LKQDSRRDGQHACNAQGHRVLLSHAGSTTDHARCGAAGWRSLAVWGQSAVNGQLTCGSSYKHDGSGNRVWIARAAAQEPPSPAPILPLPHGCVHGSMQRSGGIFGTDRIVARN
jgi:hypothetical protein